MSNYTEWNEFIQESKDKRRNVYEKQNIEDKLIKKGCQVTEYNYATGITIIVHPEHGKMFFYPRTNTLKLFKYKETIKKKGKKWIIDNINWFFINTTIYGIIIIVYYFVYYINPFNTIVGSHIFS
jgi:hypothetical protein